MRFSHIIATKGRPELLRAALESSLANLPADAELIVVDGDPERSASAVVEEFASRSADQPIRYIASAPGLPVQRNVGIEAAQCDVVVFTDDDCTLAPGLFEALARGFDDPAVVGATGRVLEPPGDRIGSNSESRLRWLVLGGGRQGTMTSFGYRRPIVDVDRSRAVEWMPGALMSARRSVAARVRFDERLSGYALGEDDDFSYRLSRQGRICYLPSAAVNHQALGTRSMDRRAQDRLVVVNRIYLFRKNFGGTVRGKLGFVAMIGVIMGHRIVNREWQGVRGLFDGLRDVWRMRRGGGEPAGPP